MFLMTDELDNPSGEHPMATLPNVNTAGINSGGNRVRFAHTPTSHGGTRRHADRGTTRPVTRSSTRVNATARNLSGSRRARGGPIPYIEMATDSDQD